MNAKLRNGLVMGSALTAIFLSQVACGSGPNVVVPPTATPAESNIETIVFDPATGIGCEKLHDISGAKAAGVSYESFVDELYDNNKSSYGLEFFYPATGGKSCHIRGSPALGDDSIDEKYAITLKTYDNESNRTYQYEDAGVARFMP